MKLYELKEIVLDASGGTARRDEAISGEYEYGPHFPDEVNATFWRDKAAFAGTTVRDAQTMRCSSCAHFNVSRPVVEWLTSQEVDQFDADARSSFGFCEFHEFKAAANRTCGCWIPGGPIRR